MSAADAPVAVDDTRYRRRLDHYLALLPAALGLGAGADTNGPLAIAVIGGMITATLLTLVVIPAVYMAVPSRIDATVETDADVAADGRAAEGAAS